eukprot:m.54792 g.54792  ORF g.54792 m.54792 type:complete len:105 (-) comp9214_c0_seq2:308-622(-)
MRSGDFPNFLAFSKRRSLQEGLTSEESGAVNNALLRRDTAFTPSPYNSTGMVSRVVVTVHAFSETLMATPFLEISASHKVGKPCDFRTMATPAKPATVIALRGE